MEKQSRDDLNHSIFDHGFFYKVSQGSSWGYRWTGTVDGQSGIETIYAVSLVTFTHRKIAIEYLMLPAKYFLKVGLHFETTCRAKELLFPGGCK